MLIHDFLKALFFNGLVILNRVRVNSYHKPS
jgi:hypothetical protein